MPLENSRISSVIGTRLAPLVRHAPQGSSEMDVEDQIRGRVAHALQESIKRILAVGIQHAQHAPHARPASIAAVAARHLLEAVNLVLQASSRKL